MDKYYRNKEEEMPKVLMTYRPYSDSKPENPHFEREFRVQNQWLGRSFLIKTFDKG
jgi:hypothetical protein